jgi:hypothetical protein
VPLIERRLVSHEFILALAQIGEASLRVRSSLLRSHNRSVRNLQFDEFCSKLLEALPGSLRIGRNGQHGQRGR